MKTLLITSCVLIILSLGCDSGSKNKVEQRGRQKAVGIKDGKNVDINYESEIFDSLVKDKVSDAGKAKALPIYSQDSLSAIIAICNYKIEQTAKLRFLESAEEKSVFLKNGFTDSIKITIYHIDNMLISTSTSNIVNNVEVQRLGYFFDENNNCIARYQWSLESKYSYYDVLYNNTLIRYDINDKFIPLGHEVKKQIIGSSKASLDSIMQYFPEFKYTLQWK
jgi:hypothetical protein